eukprot:TRINITY_DN64535_c0_g1_i1.p1 TRINITY_DN64535_c0_g1~~TRINITY_DN64535_c0_g1_i1.p1  ORF type:complete len:192 (+),score=38.27 TRINITY_DN64535_c0_g1_i1:68-577(+)
MVTQAGLRRTAEAKQSPDKKPIRSQTEYIRSPAQLNKVKTEELNQTKQQVSAKNFFRKNEAQMCADLFRARVEQEMEEELEMWRVLDYQGNLVSKALLKVQVGEEECVHLFATRRGRNEPWVCRFMPDMTKDSVLDQNEDDYMDLPERRMCAERFDMNSCTSTENCTVM